MAQQLPERVRDKATPGELARRLAILREEHQRGLLPAAEFKTMLSVFQFKDEAGYTWAPGAQSGRWYRWDGRQWTPGPPPEYLYLPDDPIVESPGWRLAGLTQTEESAAIEAPPALPPALLAETAEASPPTGSSAGSRRCQCGAALDSGESFCPECGARYTPPPPSTCPSCGRVLKPGVKFCGGCGASLGVAPIPPTAAPPPPSVCSNPACRKPLKPGKRFCTSCGTPVPGPTVH